MSFFHALQHTTTRHDVPYPHWEIDQPVGEDVLKETAATFVSDGPRAYDGTRAADNGGGGKDAKLRCYVTPENVDEFPAIGKLIAELLDPATIERVEQMIDRDLSAAYLRVEVICEWKSSAIERASG